MCECVCVCQDGLIDREKQKTVTFTESLNKVLYSKLMAGFWLPFLSFSVSPEFLFPGLFILERWLCSVYRTHSLGGLYPRQTSWKKRGARRGGVHTVWTNGQPEQDMEVYSPWVCRFGRGAASAQTHTCTNARARFAHTIVGVFPLEGKVSLPPTHLFPPSLHSPPFLLSRPSLL